MTTSPFHFVPSTPCLRSGSALTSIRSPAAVVPEMRVRSSTSGLDTPQFSRPLALVPRTPHMPSATVNRTQMQSRKLARPGGVVTPSSPQVAGDAEQVVPSTPKNLVNRHHNKSHTKRKPESENNNVKNQKGNVSRRETMLRKRLSIQHELERQSGNTSIDLFNNDADIFIF